ncbi:MAG: glycerophosphodiester phosphodiesterase [Candidatus Hodarchaeota archaeon]
MKPYVFGHRGASAYEIENTISAFKKAVSMGAGIEADVQLTKDNKLICFHDLFFLIGSDSYIVSKLTLKEIRSIKFTDNREIPLVNEVYENFKQDSDKLRYSFDIADKKTGIELLNLTDNYHISDNIEITDRRILVLSLLRKQNKFSKLVYTLAENVNKISDKTINLEKLRKLNIDVINVRYKKNIENIFKDIIDNGLKCYIWGINTKENMKRVIRLRYNDEIVDAVYTDYPDILLNFIRDYYK